MDKLLSVTLNYNHILYCIDNETNAHPDWGFYWAKYIRSNAKEKGAQIEVTEMWDTFDPTNGAIPGVIIQDPDLHYFTKRSNVSSTLNHPETYSFIDISNNSAQTGRVHYKTGHWVWNQVQQSGKIRPINTVKIYGSDNTNWAGAGTSQDAGERFWRNIFAGAASSRVCTGHGRDPAAGHRAGVFDHRFQGNRTDSGGGGRHRVAGHAGRSVDRTPEPSAL